MACLTFYRVNPATDKVLKGYLCDSESDLPISGLVTGEMAIVKDSQKLFIASSATTFVEKGAGGAAAWGSITGTLSAQTDLNSALGGKEPSNANIQAHVTSAHAPSGAQVNADITKAEIEAKLTGELSSHTHSGGAGDVVYVATPANTAINSTTDVTIVTRDVTGVAANDQLIVEASFIILNNSTATRVYTITTDFDVAFDVEHATGACAFSSTLLHPFQIRAVLNVRASNLAYATFTTEGQLAAGIASGGDTTMAATHLRAMGWGTTASDLTGTVTVVLKVRSANATATQTLYLLSLTIRKVTPT